MNDQHPIAIIGGGPAGAMAGSLLASGDRDVCLFDEKLAWEKPCGGGVTHKALQQYPFLMGSKTTGPEAHLHREDNLTESSMVELCELISPSGKRVRFRLQQPVAIFSRLALNGLLLEKARSANVDIHQERVIRLRGEPGNWKLTTPQRDYPASYVIFAAGARSSFRATFLSPIAPGDLMVTSGYFIPGRRSLLQIQFLKQLSGYIWVFPRADHVSAGIAAKMGEIPTAELRRMLEKWLHDNGFDLHEATFYSHILPSFRAQTFDDLKVCGEGWAMIGDSAGLVDPITGEGLYYALRSAELCAAALLTGRPNEYGTFLKEDVIPELKLAARVSRRFYNGQILGDSVLEQLVSFSAKSASFRQLMSDLFAGIQGYRDLRSRLYRIIPAVMAETMSWSWTKRPTFITDPFAE